MTRKYRVNAGVLDALNCFRFKNPFYGASPAKYIHAEAPIVDNPSAVREWFLFGSTAGADGSVDASGVCVSPQLTDTVLSGGAPGSTNSVYPDDVGKSFEQFPVLTLQVHYNNPNFQAVEDASGVAFCSTTTKPRNIASTVVLGIDVGISIPANSRDDVPGGRGTCGNLFRTGTGTATIVSSWPHMGKLGTGFTTELIRDEDRVRFVTNVPLGSWRFDAQKHYPHDERSDGRIEVRPGDSLLTTCYYRNPSSVPVGFGIGGMNESCYDFVVAYPSAQLKQGCGALSFGFLR
jgi:hypothetical protein